ncbi:chaplin family protein [Streptomyces sp. NPDC005263]|uniref:chaplin family protein n=1 Tax=Streptomyces sp. NPDC005263 TaxID=3364711 RepID=UPI0036A3DF49
MIAVVAASGAMAVAAPASAACAPQGAFADGAAVGSSGPRSGDTAQFPAHAAVNLCENTMNVVGLLNPAAGNRCANGSGDGSARGLSAEDASSWTGARGGADTWGWTGAHGGAEARGGGMTTRGGAGTHSGAGLQSVPGLHEGAGTQGRATSSGGGIESLGMLSGNGVHLPVQAPVNLIGNSVNVVGVHPVVGNESVTPPGDRSTVPDRPGRPRRPDGPGRPDRPVRPAHRPTPPQTSPVTRSIPPQHLTGALADTGADRTVPALLGSAALILGGAVVYRRYRPQSVR